jgi:hypothetical protein
MAEQIAVTCDIPEDLHEAFRDLLPRAQRAGDVGKLIAMCFEAGVVAEREACAKTAEEACEQGKPFSAASHIRSRE